MRAAALCLLLFAVPAAAADDRPLPGLYDVTAVAVGDVLNVREAPGVDAPVIGTLAADARGVELVARDASGLWGQVNTRERAGWVALRYLAAEPSPWEAGRLPAQLACYGTEPFWSLLPTAGQVVYRTPDGGDAVLELAAVLDTGIAGDPRRGLIATADRLRLTATIAPGTCNDGMSDRAYGLDVMVLVESGTAPRLLTGCCSIAP